MQEETLVNEVLHLIVLLRTRLVIESVGINNKKLKSIGKLFCPGSFPEG